MTMFMQAISDHLTTAPPDRVAWATYPGQRAFRRHGAAVQDMSRVQVLAAPPPTTTPIVASIMASSGLDAVGARIRDDDAACRHSTMADAIPPRFVSNLVTNERS